MLAAAWDRAAVLPPLASFGGGDMDAERAPAGSAAPEEARSVTPLCALLSCSAAALEAMRRATFVHSDDGRAQLRRVWPHCPPHLSSHAATVLALARLPLDAAEALEPQLRRALAAHAAVVEAPAPMRVRAHAAADGDDDDGRGAPSVVEDAGSGGGRAAAPEVALVAEREGGSGVAPDAALLRAAADAHAAALARREGRQGGAPRAPPPEQWQQPPPPPPPPPPRSQQRAWTSAVRRAVASFRLAAPLRAHAARFVAALGGTGAFLALRLAPLPRPLRLPMARGAEEAWAARLQAVARTAPFAAAARAVAAGREGAAAVATAPVVLVAVESGVSVSCHDDRLFGTLSEKGFQLECIPPPSTAAPSLPHDLVVAAVAAQSAAFVGSEGDTLSHLVSAWRRGEDGAPHAADVLV